MSGGVALTTPALTRAFEERCEAFGLPTCLLGPDGEVVRQCEGEGASVLRAGAIMSMVTGAAMGWREAVPAVCEPARGMRLIAFEEIRRRRRSGVAVAVALGPESLGERWMAAALREANLSDLEGHRVMARVARFEAHDVEIAVRILRLMARDLARLDELEESVAGFTHQLTESFETIDLLYGLGRSIGDLTRPQQFIRTVARRLQASMPFRWTGAWMGLDPKVGRLVGGELTLAGECGIPSTELVRIASEVCEKGSEERGAAIVPTPDPRMSGGPQIIVQPVVRHNGDVVGVLMCGDKHGDDPMVSSYDTNLLGAACGHVAAFIDNAALYAEHQATFMGALKAMTAAIDAKDRYTRGHSERVALLARSLALAAGLGEETAERLHICGLVHDIGKIGVPEAVLTKPGRLTEEEFASIRRHPELGFEILKDIPQLEDILPGVLMHHERFDGRGYPYGLKGEAIKLFGRVLALADTFDAMSSNRSYRSAMPREKVLEEIRRCAGTQFDPNLATVFIALDFGEFDEMMRRHAATDGPFGTRAAA